MANHCNLCGEAISYSLDEWKITVTTWSNYSSQDREFTFHQRCYERGKTQLIDVVADADCLSARICFDKRDDDQLMDKAGAQMAKINRVVGVFNSNRRAARKTMAPLVGGLFIVSVFLFIYLSGWLCLLGAIPLILALVLLCVFWFF